MTKKDKEDLQKMMIVTFNDGFEQVVVPRLEDMEERFDEKLKKMGKELREEFKSGQQSLSNRLEEMEVDMRQMNKKMDQVLEKNEDHGRRLDKVERIIKVN